VPSPRPDHAGDVGTVRSPCLRCRSSRSRRRPPRPRAARSGCHHKLQRRGWSARWPGHRGWRRG
jgi:hypothetical protein